MHIDPFKRYQSSLKIEHLYPHNNQKLCRCGCNLPLPSRKRSWYNQDHQQVAVTRFFVMKGDVQVIRRELSKRDNQVCSKCNNSLEKDPTFEWQADHIIEVRHGGGGCELEGYQTLCVPCHKVKTKENHKRASK